MNFVELIQLGFHGFAFALFFLCIKRFGDISNRPRPPELTVEQIKARDVGTKMELGTLKLFMAFALLFFALGVAAQIYSKKVPQKFLLLVSPHPLPGKVGVPTITKRDTPEPLDALKDGHHELSIVENDYVTVSFMDLAAYVVSLEAANRIENSGLQLDEIGG